MVLTRWAGLVLTGGLRWPEEEWAVRMLAERGYKFSNLVSGENLVFEQSHLRSGGPANGELRITFYTEGNSVRVPSEGYESLVQ